LTGPLSPPACSRSRLLATIELIEALEAVGELDAATARTAQATLLVEFHALLGFDHDLFVEAAQLNLWRARGVAAALTARDLERTGGGHELCPSDGG
jgi:hypothetical protein